MIKLLKFNFHCRYDSEAKVSDSDDEEGEKGGGMEVEEPQSRKRKKDSSKAAKPAKRRKEVIKGREGGRDRGKERISCTNYFVSFPSGIIVRWWW